MNSSNKFVSYGFKKISCDKTKAEPMFIYEYSEM